MFREVATITSSQVTAYRDFGVYAACVGAAFGVLVCGAGASQLAKEEGG
jgi:hypothetical protein